jgi:hypothetical protein
MQNKQGHMKRYPEKYFSFAVKLRDYVLRFNPFRPYIVEVEVKMVGPRVVYHYTRVGAKKR